MHIYYNCKLNSNTYTLQYSLKMYMEQDNLKFYDFLGHIDTPVVINSSGKGIFKTQGKNVSVYIKQS